MVLRGRVSDPAAALSGSQPNAPGFAGGYLLDELSGGQFVLVNEADNLGVAIYNLRQGEGNRHETLFRDETVGALDTTNAKEYVRMLRRAMDLGGFHQVVFICHTPLVWELADRILTVGGGSVFVGHRGLAITGPRSASIPLNPNIGGIHGPKDR
jgi:energy-coupling factor transporter ATP-binding protein EcfA2